MNKYEQVMKQIKKWEFFEPMIFMEIMSFEDMTNSKSIMINLLQLVP